MLTKSKDDIGWDVRRGNKNGRCGCREIARYDTINKREYNIYRITMFIEEGKVETRGKPSEKYTASITNMAADRPATDRPEASRMLSSSWRSNDGSNVYRPSSMPSLFYSLRRVQKFTYIIFNILFIQHTYLDRAVCWEFRLWHLFVNTAQIRFWGINH